jgi:HlyD family secretion protein
MPILESKTLIILAGLALASGTGVTVYQYRPLAVEVLKVETQFPVKVFGLGTVEARVVSKIAFKVAGTLTELRADHGDRVTANQVLAQIDSREQTARVARARAQVASAEAVLQVTEAAVGKAESVAAQRTQTNRRRQTLREREIISAEAAEDAQLIERVAQADLLVARTEVQTARAKLDDARAQYDYEKVILSQHELRAPFDGVVVSRSKELGSVAAAGEVLFTLVAPETVWVLAYVDEARAGGIRVGLTAEIKLRSLPGQTFSGRVTRIGMESDRVNEERRVYLTCDNCPAEFFLGEQAEVYITTTVLDRALMVPEAAIEQFDGVNGTIWTVENGTLRRRVVRFGSRSHDGRVRVIDGLPEEALVASSIGKGFGEERSVRLSGTAR